MRYDEQDHCVSNLSSDPPLGAGKTSNRKMESGFAHHIADEHRLIESGKICKNY